LIRVTPAGYFSKQSQIWFFTCRLKFNRFQILQSLLLILGIPGLLYAAAPADIQVDQTGYMTNETKLAMITNAAATGTFYVVSTSGPTTVFTGTLGSASTDTNSGLSIRDADFSTVTATGTYYLDVAGLGQSYHFSIGPNAFSNAFYETTRFYTVQRCGAALTIVNAGTTWIHGACHKTGASNSRGTTVNTSSTPTFQWGNCFGLTSGIKAFSVPITSTCLNPAMERLIF
jgi:endoglucanase